MRVATTFPGNKRNVHPALTFLLFFGLALTGCSRPAAEPVVVAVPVPVLVTAPAVPPVPPLAAVVPLSLGVPPGGLRPVPVTLPADTGGRLVADLLRPAAPPLQFGPLPALPPPDSSLDRGHLPLPEVPPPSLPTPLPPPALGSPTPPPDRTPADLGDKYMPDLKALKLPDRWPPAGLGAWLIGLAGGPLPGLVGCLP